MAYDEIMKIREVADLLRIAEKTAYTLAQKGTLPAFKVGGQWRFSRIAIRSWIEERTRRGQQAGGARAARGSANRRRSSGPDSAKAKARRRR